MKKIKFISVFLLAVSLCFSGCHKSSTSGKANQAFQRADVKDYSIFTRNFISMMEKDSNTKAFLEKSIELCKVQNPDKDSNPVQSLDDFYDLVEWSTKCMPWNIVPQPSGHSLYNSIDQSLNYFYWLLEQPLEELNGKGYYNNTLQYHEPIKSWLVDYTKQWGSYLDTPDSWNETYLATVKENKDFGLDNDWYEDPSNWHSFNEFFSRKLRNPEQRPIAFIDDDSVLTAPADSQPQGIWKINDKNELMQKDGVLIKSKHYNSVEELLGPDCVYKDVFADGIMTHTFLDVNDYHRYHSPVSGKILELALIPGEEAIGGTVVFEKDKTKYALKCDQPDWQAFETRSRMIIQTKDYGIVAVMPIGMSQVCSCNWLKTLKAGDEIKKGDEIGYFLFGGSDIVMIFQKNIDLEITSPASDNGGFQHILMGAEYGRLSKKS